MNDQEINIAIAEACGWEFRPVCEIPEDAPDYAERKSKAVMCWVRPGNDDWQIEQLPDFCKDFNAMHEAEQRVFNGPEYDSRFEFVSHLARILNPVHGYRMTDAVDLLDATARQRAEALLKTIGKWKQAK